jgi:hypothetical protein
VVTAAQGTASTTTVFTAPAAGEGTSGLPPAPRGRALADIVAAASDAVAGLRPEDPRWETVGAELSAVVHAIRLAYGLAGSPIGPDDTVAPVLRLRDIGRLAQITAATDAPHDLIASPAIEELPWSLQVAAA